MASVILPTPRWTPMADDIVAALRDDDELIVVCDDEDDPVTADAPDRAEVVVAGDPDGCAGKPNALAAAMERATHDIVVWTDDDVARGDDEWLARLVSHARERGAATEVPVFVGGGLWPLLEPAFVVFLSNAVRAGNHVWGGGVAFDRTALDEQRLREDLRRTVGDDTLLSTYLDDPWVDDDHVRTIRIPGTPRDSYDRIARWAKASYFFSPLATLGSLLVLVGFAVGSFAFPLAGVALATLVGSGAYWQLGLRRWTVALSFVSILVLPVALLVGILAPTFRWGPRTYRWRDAFDVSVES